MEERSFPPTFSYPDAAAQIFNYMWRYISNQRSLYETPLLPKELEQGGPDQATVAKLIETARQSGRTLLTEVESKQLLAAYGIPTVETRVATNIKASNANEAEFAILINDQFQRQGLGAELLRRLIQYGRDEKIQRLVGDILLENVGMQKVCRSLGMSLQYSHNEGVMKAVLELEDVARAQ